MESNPLKENANREGAAFAAQSTWKSVVSAYQVRGPFKSRPWACKTRAGPRLTPSESSMWSMSGYFRCEPGQGDQDGAPI